MNDYPQEVIDTLRNIAETQAVKSEEDWRKIDALNKQLGFAIGTLRGLLWCGVSEHAKEVINKALAEIDKGE